MSMRIIVADDQPLVRAGIAMLLRAEPGLEVLALLAHGLSSAEIKDHLMLSGAHPVRTGPTSATPLHGAGRGSSEPSHSRELLLIKVRFVSALYGTARRAHPSGHGRRRLGHEQRQVRPTLGQGA